LVKIQSKLDLVERSDNDKPIWVISKKGIYSIADTWDPIRSKQVEVYWWRLVWFPLAIPRHAFFFMACYEEQFIY
jgi:hypothetical protein